MGNGEARSFDAPDETRPFEGKGQSELVEVGGRPVFASGRMRILMDDGTAFEVGPGEVCDIPPGHDAEVLGDESAHFVDFGEVAGFAKPS